MFPTQLKLRIEKLPPRWQVALAVRNAHRVEPCLCMLNPEEKQTALDCVAIADTFAAGKDIGPVSAVFKKAQRHSGPIRDSAYESSAWAFNSCIESLRVAAWWMMDRGDQGAEASAEAFDDASRCGSTAKGALFLAARDEGIDGGPTLMDATMADVSRLEQGERPEDLGALWPAGLPTWLKRITGQS